MSKKIFVMLVLTIVFASFGLVTAEEISMREAEKLASEYAYEGEYAEDSSVKVYHGENPYHVVCFYKEATDKYKGAIIIDGVSGEVVTDESLARDIFEAKLRKTQGPDFDPEGLYSTNEGIQMFSSAAASFRILHTLREEGFDVFKEEVGWQPSSKLRRLEDNLTEKEKELADKSEDLADIGEGVYEIQRPLVEKLEIGGMKEFISKNDEFVAYIIETFVPGLREYQDAYIAYMDQLILEAPKEYKDISEAAKQAEIAAENTMIREFEDIKLSWDKEKEWVEEGTEWFYGVNWEVEIMKERLTEFELGSLSVPTSVEIGEIIPIKINITNVGKAKGSLTANLKINKTVVDSKEVTLDVGETETVEFMHTAENETGTYNVEVNGKTGKYEVTTVLTAVPGFEAVLAIAGLLAVPSLLRRRK